MWRMLFVLLIPATAFGQFQASGGFVVAVPQRDFAAKIDNNGYGLELSGAYTPEASPIGFGASLRFMNYGYDSRRVPFSTTTPGVSVDLTTMNNFFMFDLEARLQPGSGDIRPYLSGMLGFSILATSTTIKNESTGEEIASSNNQNDGAFNYGAGGGVDIRLWSASGEEGEESEVRDVLLRVGVSYVYGGEAEYLKEGSIRDIGGGQVQYDLQRSRTDLLLYQIGVSVTF